MLLFKKNRFTFYFNFDPFHIEQPNTKDVKKMYDDVFEKDQPLWILSFYKNLFLKEATLVHWS